MNIICQYNLLQSIKTFVPALSTNLRNSFNFLAGILSANTLIKIEMINFVRSEQQENIDARVVGISIFLDVAEMSSAFEHAKSMIEHNLPKSYPGKMFEWSNNGHFSYATHIRTPKL